MHIELLPQPAARRPADLARRTRSSRPTTGHGGTSARSSRRFGRVGDGQMPVDRGAARAARPSSCSSGAGTGWTGRYVVEPVLGEVAAGEIHAVRPWRRRRGRRPVRPYTEDGRQDAARRGCRTSPGRCCPPFQRVWRMHAESGSAHADGRGRSRRFARVVPLVAHVIYRLDVGGLENGVVNLINRMPRGPLPPRDRLPRPTTPIFAAASSAATFPYSISHKPPGNSPVMHFKLWRLLRAVASRHRAHAQPRRAGGARSRQRWRGCRCAYTASTAATWTISTAATRAARACAACSSRSCITTSRVSRDLASYLEQQGGRAARAHHPDLQRREHRAVSPGAQRARAAATGRARGGGSLRDRHGRAHAGRQGPAHARARVHPAHAADAAAPSGGCGWS